MATELEAAIRNGLRAEQCACVASALDDELTKTSAAIRAALQRAQG